MSLDALFPIAGDHAIQNLTCGLEWKEPLVQKDFGDLKTRVEQRLHAFRHFEPHQQLMVNVSPGSAPNVVSGAGGFTCSTNPAIGEAPRRSINFSPDQVLFAVNEYPGWATVKKDLDSYTREVINTVGGKSRALTSIGLQYTDVFQWKGDPQTLAIDEIFRRDTPYLTPTVLNAKSYWHCNQGLFTESKLPNTRLLLNVNVQRVQAGGMDALSIITAHKLVYTSPSWSSAEEKIELVASVFETFHGDNKILLKSLLTDAVCEKIKLI